MRKYRKVIAINAVTKERKEFTGTYEAAKVLGTAPSTIQLSIAQGNSIKGWYVYDTPEVIRERIKKLEEQVEMLEN